MSDEKIDPYAGLQDRLAKTADEARPEAVAKRRARKGRTARENLADLTDGTAVSRVWSAGGRRTADASRR